MINYENLNKLADFVEKHQPSLRYNFYRTNDDCNYTDFVSATECGTFGCLMGMAPLVPGLEPIASDYHINRNEKLVLDWVQYSIHIFNIDPAGIDGEEEQDAEWNYLFSMDWQLTDPSFEGAVKRLRNFQHTDVTELVGYNSDYETYSPHMEDIPGELK